MTTSVLQGVRVEERSRHTGQLCMIESKLRREAYITSQRRMLESVGHLDAKSNIYNAIENGIEHADYITVRAPKPMMIVTTTRDYFRNFLNLPGNPDEEEIEQLVKKGFVVAAPDLIGVGETENTIGKYKDHVLDYTVV